MRKTEPYTGFEQGPIRPPSEAKSLLIRITRNCPWNRCTFCPVYKGTTFSRRPVEHVLKDIDMVQFYVEAIERKQQSDNYLSPRELHTLLQPKAGGEREALHAAHNFIAGGMKSIFLQDGNSLIIKPDNMVRILIHLRKSFPKVNRITSYARSQTIAKISDEDLVRISASGLNRIHIGLESGADSVLRKVKKGSDKATQILAGQKVKRAGMELSEYYMPGLGGRSLSREHALETADALNQINPDFIRLRTLALPGSAPLTEEYNSGKFDKPGDVEIARELLLFLESLDNITSSVKSDHVLNLFQEVEGVLPGDKKRIIAPIRTFLRLEPREQMIFCIGRRTHNMSRLADLNNPTLHGYAEQTCNDLGITVENMDAAVSQIMQRFI